MILQSDIKYIPQIGTDKMLGICADPESQYCTDYSLTLFSRLLEKYCSSVTNVATANPDRNRVLFSTTAKISATGLNSKINPFVIVPIMASLMGMHRHSQKIRSGTNLAFVFRNHQIKPLRFTIK
jgi:hypothetical protein